MNIFLFIVTLYLIFQGAEFSGDFLALGNMMTIDLSKVTGKRKGLHWLLFYANKICLD
jgi:hypothetical protein